MRRCHRRPRRSPLIAPRRPGRARRTLWRVALLVGAGLSLPGTTPAHPPSGWDGARYTLVQWANGLANRDPVAIAPLLRDDFQFDFGFIQLTRDQYLAQIGADGPIYAGASIAAAFHEETGENRIVVRPVLLEGSRQITTPSPASVELVSAGEVWKIARIVLGTELPEGAVGRLPEHEALHTVRVRVRDADSGAAVASRVHVRDAAGEYWPPRGHQKNIATGWRQDVGRDVILGDRTYAYVPAEFELPLPEGTYTLEVWRGMQYVPKTAEFRVAKEEVPKLDVSIERWSDVQKEGWYSGDTHVHFLDPGAAILEMQAEDLNVLNILATKWSELITNVEHFTGRPSDLSEPDHIVFVGEETRHGFLGHTALLGLRHLVYPLTWGVPPEGVPGGTDETTMAAQADRAHAAGGLVVWAHFPSPGGELPADLALGKLDSIDLMTWGDSFAPAGPAPGAVETWYRFLNAGFRIPATGGTDKMLNTQVSGSVRVYAKVAGEFSYAAWLDAIRAGRTFVTTGPMLELSAGDHEIGDDIRAGPGDSIPVIAEVHSHLPVEWLEIVVSGEVVARVENPQGVRSLRVEAEVPVPGSTWIAASAYSKEMQPYQRWLSLGALGLPVMAHTSPVWVTVPGHPQRSPEDSRFLGA